MVKTYKPGYIALIMVLATAAGIAFVAIVFFILRKYNQMCIANGNRIFRRRGQVLDSREVSKVQSFREMVVGLT